MDHNLKELLNKASVALFTRIAAAFVTFLLNLVFARTLGAEEAGKYFLALSVLMVFATVGKAGLENSVVKFTSFFAAKEDWNKLKGLVKSSLLVAIVFSSVAILLMFFSSGYLANDIFNKNDLLKPLHIMTLAIFPMVVFTIFASTSRGLKKIFVAQFFNSLSLPLFTLLIYYIFIGRFHLQYAVISYLLATLLTAILSVLVWRLRLFKYRGSLQHFSFRNLLESSMPLLLITLVSLLMNHAPTIIMGRFSTSTEIGIYNVALRISLLTTFILLAVNSIAAPQFAELFKTKELEKLESLAVAASNVLVVTTVPLCIVIFLFPKFILGLFGNEFLSGAAILIILTIGQLINVSTGSVGTLLMMTNNERTLRNNVIATSVLSVGLAFFLIREYSMFGAAIAYALSVIILNINSSILVRLRLGFWVFPFKHLKLLHVK